MEAPENFGHGRGPRHPVMGALRNRCKTHPQSPSGSMTWEKKAPVTWRWRGPDAASAGRRPSVGRGHLGRGRRRGLVDQVRLGLVLDDRLVHHHLADILL